MDSTLQIRIDKKTKEAAQKTFRSMGLDISSGIKLYLTQVINRKEIPFQIISADLWSDEKKDRLVNESKEALKKGRGFNTAEEIHKDILGE
jgi:DNA-damage-inducible protein J